MWCEYRTQSKQSPKTTCLVNVWSESRIQCKQSPGDNPRRVPTQQAKSVVGVNARHIVSRVPRLQALSMFGVSPGHSLSRVQETIQEESLHIRPCQCLECESRTPCKQSPKTTGLVNVWSASPRRHLSKAPRRQALSMFGVSPGHNLSRVHDDRPCRDA